MSRTVRRQVLEVLSTLNKANTILNIVIEKRNKESMFSLLEECQTCAIEMGTRIEEVWRESGECIAILEEYCEILYQLSESLNERTEWKRKYKKSCQLLENFERTFKEKIPDKLEIVFLPYKASMWDSLESVWLAAKEDEDCEAYVIPIPYFDKQPDGSFKEEHYEGDLYPNYVPVTRYDEYDFEKRRPDMIFIHNPYDEGNYVTSVHPLFYSGNIKKYTEKLVYIPYFTLEEVNVYDEQAIDKMEHFCLVSGVINADKVVVQSDAMRQVYIKVLLRNFGDDEKKRKYWENKILGIGSPKFDKLMYTDKDNVLVPNEWVHVITKSNGNRKKIIFYNNSINSLLKNEDKVLYKLQKNFEFFKQHQEEIALLWRPHPLLKATIESMRPQLWKSYQRIVEQYQLEGWGIYDDSADLNRSIAISDVYYGDKSSIVSLFQKAGKPVMLQKY